MELIDPGSGLHGRSSSMNHVNQSSREVPAVPRLFLSYRRGESEDFTLRLRDYLSAQLVAEPFVDTQEVRGGRLPWPDQLQQALEGSSALIVVVGPRWVADPRLVDLDDWVRREILTALQAGLPIYVVTVNQTSPLRATDLPEDIAALAMRQSLQIRAPKLSKDAEELVEWLASGGIRRKRRRRDATQLIAPCLRAVQFGLLSYLVYRFARALTDTDWSVLISSTQQPQAVLFGLEVPFVVITILTPLMVIASDRLFSDAVNRERQSPLSLDAALGVVVLVLASHYIWITSNRTLEVCRGFCPGRGFAVLYSVASAIVGSVLLVNSYARWRPRRLPRGPSVAP